MKNEILNSIIEQELRSNILVLSSEELSMRLGFSSVGAFRTAKSRKSPLIPQPSIMDGNKPKYFLWDVIEHLASLSKGNTISSDKPEKKKKTGRKRQNPKIRVS